MSVDLRSLSPAELRQLLQRPDVGAVLRRRIEGVLQETATEPVPAARTSGPRMNQTEARYAAHLDTLQRAGTILRWDFEPEKLRLATAAFYSPDFRVVMPDGTVEFHEVKGRKGAGFYAREDARLKVRIAAEMHPYRFFVVWPRKGGRGWERKEFTSHLVRAVHARAIADGRGATKEP